MQHKCNVKYLYCIRIIVMQVTHEKCKGGGVFIK